MSPPLPNPENHKFVIAAALPHLKGEVGAVAFYATRQAAEAQLPIKKTEFPDYTDWAIVELGS